MKKILFVSFLLLCFVLVSGCIDTTKYVETKSTITNKEIIDSNQYYFYVSYNIEGMDGLFEATIKVKNRTDYNKYSIGDEYVFKRPVSK
jgi:hypothetical protein